MIEVAGDVAYCESYAMASHRSEREGVEYDLVVGVRYVDRFERREGVWKIAHRKAVQDWNRIDPVAESIPIVLNAGLRTRQDPVYLR